MSKFLRFIVNLFIVVAVLTAAAILIPPLAGVNTTIVDSASMDTNLPLGSITYSRSVARSGIAAGDEVLRETSGSVYAYVIKEVGENGTYKAVSAVDDSASAQTITLDDPVLRVAVMVPWIGYVVMALQSTEGILILVLIAVLVIVLFILSELWKPDHAEDEEDEEEPEEEEPAAVSATDDGGIDTDVIRQAMNENNDELAKMEPDDDSAGFTGKQKDDAAPARTGTREILTGAPKEADAAAEHPEEDAVSAERETPQTESGEPVTPEEEETPDRGAGKKKSWRERRAEKKAKKRAGKAEKGGGTIEETPYAEEGAAGEASPAAQAAPEAPAPETSPESNAAENPENGVAEGGSSEAAGGPQAENAVPEATGASQPEAAAPEAPQAENAAPEPEMPSDPDRFIPVNRPTLGELLDEARKSGDKPKVEENEATGITTVDYTDVL